MFRHLIATLTVAFLSACSNYGVVADRVAAYNDEVADATNQMILKNILRSAYRAPLYFSTIEKATAGSRGNLAVGVSFGPGDESGGVTLNPRLTLQDPSPASTIQVDSAQKFAQGIASGIDLKTYRLLANQGFSDALLLHLLIQEIKIGNVELVNNPKDEKNYQKFRDVLNLLIDKGIKIEGDTRSAAVGPIMNRSEAVDFIRSQGFLSERYSLKAVSKSGEILPDVKNDSFFQLHRDLTKAKVVFPKDVKPNVNILAELKNDNRAYAFTALFNESPEEINQSKEVEQLVRAALIYYKCIDDNKENPSNCKKQSTLGKVDVEFRSTLSIFSYLGAIVAKTTRVSGSDSIVNGQPAIPLENRPYFIPKESVSDEEGRILVFVVCRGALVARSLTSTSYEGERYYLPSDRNIDYGIEPDCMGSWKGQTQNDRAPDHRSSQAIAVLAQLINLNRDASELSDVIRVQSE